jgi:hypothetical protein
VIFSNDDGDLDWASSYEEFIPDGQKKTSGSISMNRSTPVLVDELSGLVWKSAKVLPSVEPIAGVREQDSWDWIHLLLPRDRTLPRRSVLR